MVNSVIVKWIVLLLMLVGVRVWGAQPPDIIDLNPGQVLILPPIGSTEELTFSPQETWVYEPRITCSSAAPDHVIHVTVEIIPQNPLIQSTKEEGECAQLTSFTMDKHLLLSSEQYTFKITYEYYEGLPEIPPFLVVQSVLMVPKVEPASWDGGLIDNGNFIGPNLWELNNGALHEMIEGPSEAATGTLVFTDASTSDSSASSIKQSFHVAVTGLYRLTFSCQTVTQFIAYRGKYKISLTSTNDPVIAPAVFEGDCSRDWETRTHDILLLANRSYDFNWIYRIAGHLMLAKEMRIDNLEIQHVGPPEMEDDGILTNGGFVDYHYWDLSPSTFFNMHRGFANTQLGALLFTDPESTDNQITSAIRQQVLPAGTDIYKFNVSCLTLSGISSRKTELKYIVRTLGDPLARPAVMKGTCYNQWTELSFNHLLVGGKMYEIELVYAMPSVAGLKVLIDNVSLTTTMRLDNPETGLVMNGGFVGEAGWQFSPQAYYVLNSGFNTAQLGAAEIRSAQHQVSQVIVPNVTDTYSVRFACKNTSGFSGTNVTLEYRVAQAGDSRATPIVHSFTCTTEWKIISLEHSLSGGLPYQVSLKYIWTSRAGATLLIDNLSIFGQEIPVPETKSSCIEWLAQNPKAQNGVYRVDPDGANTNFPAYDVYCDMEHGGLTFLYAHEMIETSDGARPVLPTSKLTDNDSCKDLALNLFAPRSENEYKIARDYLRTFDPSVWGSERGLGPLGIFSFKGSCVGAVCVDQPLPPQAFNSANAMDWRSTAGNQWWGSNYNFSKWFEGFYHSPRWLTVSYCADEFCPMDCVTGTQSMPTALGDVCGVFDDNISAPYTSYMCASPDNLTLPAP